METPLLAWIGLGVGAVGIITVTALAIWGERWSKLPDPDDPPYYEGSGGGGGG